MVGEKRTMFQVALVVGSGIGTYWFVVLDAWFAYRSRSVCVVMVVYMGIGAKSKGCEGGMTDGMQSRNGRRFEYLPSLVTGKLLGHEAAAAVSVEWARLVMETQLTMLVVRIWVERSGGGEKEAEQGARRGL